MPSAPCVASDDRRCSKAEARRTYLLILLTVVLASVRIDRVALGLCLQDIKIDLDLNDVQLGVLTGIASTLFYAALGVPIARRADRGNRVAIIAWAAAAWSISVAVSGAALGFMQLLLIRIVAAVGEAGCYPASLSLISDYFSRDDRPRAVARYMLGLPIALAVGNLATGRLNEICGWRAMFVLIGMPGMALAAMCALTLADPRRSCALCAGVVPESAAHDGSLKEVARVLWSSAAYRHLLLCFSIWGLFGYGILQWQPVFFVRSHHVTTGQLGAWMALIYGVGGFLGTYLGGRAASRFAANNESRQLCGVAIVYILLALLSAGAYLASDLYVALALLALCAIGGAASNGPLFAAIQTLVPSRMRATATALMYLFCNLVGMGVGPLVAGALSDGLQPWLEEESLRYALLALCPGYLWCAWHLRRASRAYLRDASLMQAREDALLRGDDPIKDRAECALVSRTECRRRRLLTSGDPS